MTVATELLVILALVLANGAFAGAEIAILSVRKTRIQELADEGSRAARAVLRMRSKPETFLATVQIGITVVSATAAAFGGATLARVIAALLARAGAGAYAEDLALASVVALVSTLSLILGELVPKSLALRSAERYALVAAPPLRALAWLARPLVWGLTATSNFVLRFFGDQTNFSEARLSKEELQQLVDEAATAGALDRRAGDIAYRALDFADIRVGALVVPRAEMVVLARDATEAGIRRLLIERGHSRIPVFGDAPEDIIGYVTARDVIAMLAGDGRALGDILREALFVPEGRLAADVLKDMQNARDHLAMVVDAQGAVVGLVTLEDLVEELVGEVFAEHETPIERVRREPDGRVLVRGRMPVHELNRELGLELPESTGWTTIGGLVTAHAGEIPKAGRRVTLEDGVVLEVVEATERRVQAVRIHPVRTADPEESED